MSELNRFLITRCLVVLFASLTVFGLPACAGDDDLATEKHIANAKDYQDKGELRAAVIELKNALLKIPESIEARWLLGQIYLEQGAAEAAEKELRRSVEFGMAPEAAEVSLTRALLLQSKYQEVIDSTVNPESLSEPNRAELLALRANAYLGLGEIDKADELFDTALSIKADSPEALTGKATILVARNQLEETRIQLAAVFEISPEFAQAWAMLGQIEHLEGNLELAEKAYTHSMQDPVYKDVSQFNLALIRIRQAKFDQAEKDISDLRKRLGQSSGVYYLEGLLHFQEERLVEALGSFEAALGMVPDHIPSLFFAGATHMILGNHASAKNYLHRYLARNPNGVLAKRLLAQVELAGGDWVDAERHARAILEKSPDDVLTMSLLAASLSGQGNQDAAVDYLTQVVAAQPESSAAREQLGITLMNQGDVDKGQKELERVLELDQGSYQATDRIVRKHLQTGDLETALKLAREHVDRQPEEASAHVLLGVVYLKRKELDKASNAFQQALDIESEYIPAYHGIALASIQEKQLDRAEEYYREALKYRPGDIQTLMNLANLKALQGDHAARKTVLEEAIESNPKTLEPRLILGRIYLEAGEADKTINMVGEMRYQHVQNKNLMALLGQAELAVGRYAEAKSTLTHLTEMAPDDARVHLLLAAANDGLNDQRKIRESLEKATMLDPDLVPAQIALVRLDLQENKIGEAESRAEMLEKRLGGDNPVLMDIKAQLAERKGDFIDAVNLYQQLYIHENNSTNLSRLSRAQWQAGHRDVAILTLEQWVQEHPQDVRMLLELAQRYLDTQRANDAIKRYESVLEIAPDNALALNNLANILHETEPQAAMRYAERAYTLAPQDPAAMDTLAVVLLSNGDVKRAARMVELALAIQPDNPSFLYRRAQILEVDGQQDAAVNMLRDILQSGRKFPERTEAEAMLERLNRGS